MDSLWNEHTAKTRVTDIVNLVKRLSFSTAQFSCLPLAWMFHNPTINNKINHLHQRYLSVIYIATNYFSSEIWIYFSSHQVSPNAWDRSFKFMIILLHKLLLKFLLGKTLHFSAPHANSISHWIETFLFLGPNIWKVVSISGTRMYQGVRNISLKWMIPWQKWKV